MAIRIYAELSSDQLTPCVVPFMGVVSQDKPLVLNEFQIVKVEARVRKKFGEIQLPPGISLVMELVEEE